MGGFRVRSGRHSADDEFARQVNWYSPNRSHHDRGSRATPPVSPVRSYSMAGGLLDPTGYPRDLAVTRIHVVSIGRPRRILPGVDSIRSGLSQTERHRYTVPTLIRVSATGTLHRLTGLRRSHSFAVRDVRSAAPAAVRPRRLQLPLTARVLSPREGREFRHWLSEPGRNRADVNCSAPVRNRHGTAG